MGKTKFALIGDNIIVNEDNDNDTLSDTLFTFITISEDYPAMVHTVKCINGCVSIENKDALNG